MNNVFVNVLIHTLDSETPPHHLFRCPLIHMHIVNITKLVITILVIIGSTSYITGTNLYKIWHCYVQHAARNESLRIIVRVSVCACICVCACACVSEVYKH